MKVFEFKSPSGNPLAVFFLALVLGYRQSQILNITLDDLNYSESQKNCTLKIEIIKQKKKTNLSASMSDFNPW